MTLIPRQEEKHCFIACNQDIVKSGLCDCINRMQNKALNIPDVSVSLMAEIRQAFADYQRAEGCSCCRDIESHKEAEKRLGILLNAKPYDDGIGFDWSLYGSNK